jgi:hypothetical protein
MSMTLIDFLLARIAEDEAAAPDGSLWLGGEMPWLLEEGDPPNFPITVDPRRVLAECEAKRKIAAVCAEMEARSENIVGSYAHEILCLLALPYRDHPDFRDFWLP